MKYISINNTTNQNLTQRTRKQKDKNLKLISSCTFIKDKWPCVFVTSTGYINVNKEVGCNWNILSWQTHLGFIKVD